MTPLRQRMIDDMQLRNLAARTQKNYIAHVAAFAKYAAGELQFFGDLAPLHDPPAFARYLAPLQYKKWVVYAKAPLADRNASWSISAATPIVWPSPTADS